MALKVKVGNYSQITNDVIQGTKESIRAALYKENKKGSYANIRVKLCKALNRKSSLTLPPGPDYVTQAVKRVNIQTKILFQS